MIRIGELAFNDSPEETFNAIILETIYIFKQRWNTIGFWSIDVSDEDGVALVLGVRIMSGSFMFSQYPNIPFDLINESEIDPSRDGISEYIMEVYEK